MTCRADCTSVAINANQVFVCACGNLEYIGCGHCNRVVKKANWPSYFVTSNRSYALQCRSCKRTLCLECANILLAKEDLVCHACACEAGDKYRGTRPERAWTINYQFTYKDRSGQCSSYLRTHPQIFASRDEALQRFGEYVPVLLTELVEEQVITQLREELERQSRAHDFLAQLQATPGFHVKHGITQGTGIEIGMLVIAKPLRSREQMFE